ncbi:MAG TPA: Hpt domain-containing protein [Edaphobacter sp.]
MSERHPHPEAEIKMMLRELWLRHLPTTRERLSLLEKAVAVSGRLDEPLKTEALWAAHKLAGNLGMFGHNEAGEVACEIEAIFKQDEVVVCSHLSELVQRLHRMLEPYLIL